MNETKLYVS